MPSQRHRKAPAGAGAGDHNLAGGDHPQLYPKRKRFIKQSTRDAWQVGPGHWEEVLDFAQLELSFWQNTIQLCKVEIAMEKLNGS